MFSIDQLWQFYITQTRFLLRSGVCILLYPSTRAQAVSLVSLYTIFEIPSRVPLNTVAHSEDNSEQKATSWLELVMEKL